MSAIVPISELCRKDVEELRDIAEWFDKRGDSLNGDFLRAVATRYEVLAGAYSTASKVRSAASNFFAWANKTWPNPCGNDSHPWNVLGKALNDDRQ